MFPVPILLMVSICLMTICSEAEPQFPKPRVSTTLIEGAWIASPIVAIGEITNISSYGKQTIDRLPPPTMSDVHDLYWCRGDLQVVAVVKGEVHAASRKYLWASTIPGCKLWDEDPRFVYRRQQTRAWLLREEGEFLRPPFDYGTNRYIGLVERWEGGPDLPPENG